MKFLSIYLVRAVFAHVISMKLFDLFVHCHKEGDSTHLDAVYESPRFENQTEELMDTLPSLLFKDLVAPPEYACCHYFVLTIPDGSRFYGCSVLYNKNGNLASYALVSALPYYQTMKNVLTLVDPESDLSYLTKIPMPPPGVTSVNFYIGHQCFCVSRPPPNQLPLIDLPFWLPFALFSADDLITIFTAILVEKRIVFKSRYPTAIGPFIESMVALIYPLECFHTYVPYLLDKMKDILDSPLPYLIGVDTDKFDLSGLEPNIMLVDLDNSTITGNDMPPEIPKKPQSKLWTALNKICKRFTASKREFFLRSPGIIKEPMPEETSFDFSVPETSVNMEFVNGLCQEMIGNDKKDLFELYEAARAAFLRFLVVTLMNDPEISGKDYDVSSPFNQEFLNTQTYQSFSEAAKKFNQKKRVENLQDAKILFFKETVAAKINRSKLQRKKMPTPFLWTEYWHVQRMFRFRSDYPNCVDFVSALNELNSSSDYTTKLAYTPTAAISSPSNWQRAFPEPEKKDLERLTDKKAGLLIQKTCRMFVEKEKYQKMRRAAITMESAVKMFLAKKRFQEMRTAAIKVESVVKMFLAKKRFQEMRAAAIKMESAFRMYQARQKYLEMKSAAVKIESTFKMFQQRQKYLEMRAAAIKIESVIRMVIAKRHYQEMHSAGLVISSFARMIIAKNKYNDMKEAVVTIQSVVRRYLARKDFVEMKNAAVTIQSFARMIIARKNYLAMEKLHPEPVPVLEEESTEEVPELEEEEEITSTTDDSIDSLPLEFFVKLWRSKKSDKQVNLEKPAILTVIPEAVSIHKMQKALASSQVRIVDKSNAIINKDSSLLETGASPEKNQHKNLYKVISILQKKRMLRKPFEAVFMRFDVPVKGKKRKEKLLRKIEAIMSKDAVSTEWNQIVLAAKVILVATEAIDLSVLRDELGQSE